MKPRSFTCPVCGAVYSTQIYASRCHNAFPPDLDLTKLKDAPDKDCDKCRIARKYGTVISCECMKFWLPEKV